MFRAQISCAGERDRHEMSMYLSKASRTHLHLNVSLDLDKTHLKLAVSRRGQPIALGMYLRWPQLEAVAGLAAGDGGDVDVAAAEGLHHALFTLRTIAAIGAGALIDAALALRTVVAAIGAGALIHAGLACGCAHGRCIAGSGHIDAALALQRLRLRRHRRRLRSIAAQLKHAALALLQLPRGERVLAPQIDHAALAQRLLLAVGVDAEAAAEQLALMLRHIRY